MVSGAEPIASLGPGWRTTAWRLVPALWAGLLWCVALLATPAPFATLERAQAGLVVAHIFAREAPLSLVLAMLVVLWDRARRTASASGAASASSLGEAPRLGPSAETLLALGALFATVAGYYGLQPMLADAKAGLPTPWSFGQLHALSTAMFGVKLLCVSALAWRTAGSEASALR
jgi:hypothetical protein